MGAARHPKPYKEGKDQVTLPWKRRALEQLARNKAAQMRPENIDQLGKMLDAPKGSFNKLLDLKRSPPQLTSSYAIEISELLGIAPPVIESDDDDPDFARDVLLLRSLNIESRRALMFTAARLEKKR